MVAASELPIDTSASAVQMAQTIFGDGGTVVSAGNSGDSRSSGTFTNGDSVSAGATPSDSGGPAARRLLRRHEPQLLQHQRAQAA